MEKMTPFTIELVQLLWQRFFISLMITLLFVLVWSSLALFFPDVFNIYLAPIVIMSSIIYHGYLASSRQQLEKILGNGASPNKNWILSFYAFVFGAPLFLLLSFAFSD